MGALYAAVRPGSPAFWSAGDVEHRTSLRGRLAVLYARLAVHLLAAASRSDIRAPDFDWSRARRLVGRVDGWLAPPLPPLRREAHESGPVPGEWFLAEGGSVEDAGDATVLYVHGGSFCLDRTRLHDALAAHVAESSGVRVLALDYRLAPEHPFPTGLDDVDRTLEWLCERSGATRVGLLADSAGAALAVAALLRRRSRGAPMPAALVALCPWADLTFSGASIIDNADTDAFMSDIEMISAFAELYLQGAPADAAEASPALADLHGLPDTLIHAGSHDMLVDDARRMAASLRRGGVRVRLDLWPYLPHVWQRMGRRVPEAWLSLEGIGEFLRERLVHTREAA